MPRERGLTVSFVTTTVVKALRSVGMRWAQLPHPETLLEQYHTDGVDPFLARLTLTHSSWARIIRDFWCGRLSGQMHENYSGGIERMRTSGVAVTAAFMLESQMRSPLMFGSNRENRPRD